MARKSLVKIKKQAGLAINLGLLTLVILAVVAYFYNTLSFHLFGSLALALIVLSLLMAYFGWILIRSAGLFVVISAVLFCGVVYGQQPKPQKDHFQAVFLTNGQVYFGHLKNANSKSPVLTDVYYVQGSQPAQSDQSQAKQSLVKLSQEANAPANEMVLKSDQILFWDNLNDNGKVVQVIKQDQNK